jgi:glycosyltransferase involved in cell wall biosynthesis
VKLLTIAIPTYKSKETLHRLLASIRSEIKAFPPEQVEIVISDNDPSSNFAQDLSREYDKSFLNYLVYRRNPHNLGYDGNLESLVKLANGSHIKFIADDDEMKSGFLVRHLRLILDHDPDVIVSNFRELPLEDVGGSDSVGFEKKPITILGPPWSRSKLSLISGRFGQVSSLTFRTSLLKDLKQKTNTNFIHVYWFFKILEKSKVAYDPNLNLDVYLGSPNFSTNLVQIIDIPFRGVSAIRQAKIGNFLLRHQVLGQEKRYALQGLRLFPALDWSERTRLLWDIRMFLNSISIARYLMYLFVPKFLKKRFSKLESNSP